MKTVYVVMCAEFIHPGHINIIRVARELGEVTVGLATDEFNGRHKRVTVMSYEQRRAIVENIKGVAHVIAQDTLDLAPILRELKPDYFVHGDDWKTGRLSAVRQQVIDLLKEWGGALIEPPYTGGISSTKLNAAWRSRGTTPELRIQHFRRLLAYQPFIRILEVHSGLAGLVVEQTQVKVDDRRKEFDAMWFSRRTDSLARGKPDIDYVDLTSQLHTIHEILEPTTKPLIVDGGNGGIKEHFSFTVRTLERLGVSAVVVEDLIQVKGRAFSRDGIRPEQEDGSDFARKISLGKQAQVGTGFSIIVRISSPILRSGYEDALLRTQTYVEAGADAVMIQSEAGNLTQFLEFCRLFSKSVGRVPLLMALPPYSPCSESQLADVGIRAVIYSDHLLRAAYTNMLLAAKMLLRNSRALDVDGFCAPLDEICNVVPGFPK